ncbi:MAG: hypothetical protein BroJett040_08700 [Oligoflexia bacterium]|nr:MAG: hypothetical protein BroJett040_08700 [Oligoflexia bacterium]
MKNIPAVLTLIILLFTVSLLDFHLALAQTKPTATKYDIRSAQKLYAQKEYEKVIAELSARVEKLSRDGLLLLARSYSSIKNPIEAIKTGSIILSTNPDDFEVKTFLGQEQIHLGKDREALITLRESLELNKKYEPTYLSIAEIYERRKNKYELRLLYLDMIESLGEKPAYITKVCQLATLEGLYDLSTQYCRKGIQVDPNDYRNPLYLGLTFKETGKIEEATKLLKKTADLFPKSEEAQITWAQHLDGQKNYVASLGYYQRAVQASPNSINGLLGLAQSSFELKKYDEALQFWKKACQLNGKATNSSLRKATNVVRLSRQAELLTKFEAAVDTCIKME